MFRLSSTTKAPLLLWVCLLFTTTSVVRAEESSPTPFPTFEPTTTFAPTLDRCRDRTDTEVVDCAWVRKKDTRGRCAIGNNALNCVKTCDPKCCFNEADLDGGISFMVKNKERTCAWIREMTKKTKIRKNCKKTVQDGTGRTVGDLCALDCEKCVGPTEAPTVSPTYEPTPATSQEPSTVNTEPPTKAPTSAGPTESARPSTGPFRKNIIYFMTDDQDSAFNSTDPWVMPNLNRYLRDGGMEFNHAYASTALCCPNRAIIMRGQYCHNTEIKDNGENKIINPDGSFTKSGGHGMFRDLGYEDENFATLLRDAGYETAYIGKYMNNFRFSAAGPGWEHWMGNAGGKFYGDIFGNQKTSEDVYGTDFINDWVVDWLTNVRDHSRPFFLFVSPYAPHGPATPKREYADLFPDVKATVTPATDGSDAVQEQKPAYLKNLPPLTQKQIESENRFYRKQMQCLVSVDEVVGSIFGTLEDQGIKDETYFIYTSDNGMHYNHFRQRGGKRMAYETDIRVPFFISGPTIPPGSSTDQMIQSVDLAAFFTDVAEAADPSYPFDGKSFLPVLSGGSSNDDGESESSTGYNDFRWAGLIEMYSGTSNYGVKNYEGTTGFYKPQRKFYPNTYQAVRILKGPYDWASENLLYVEWCTGEMELYNNTADPYQIDNLMFPQTDENVAPYLGLVNQASKLIEWLGTCAGSPCHTIPESVFDAPDLPLNALVDQVKARLPCHLPDDDAFDPFAPISNATADPSRRRLPWARNLFVPEVFEHGHFPFADSDEVPEELMEQWDKVQEYFD